MIKKYIKNGHIAMKGPKGYILKLPKYQIKTL